MNPAPDRVLFGGIPPTQGRGPTNFFASIGIHAAGLGVLLLVAPEIALQTGLLRHTPLAEPAEAAPAPPRKFALPKTHPPTRTVALPRLPLPPISTPVRPAIAPLKLDEAPVLPSPPAPQASAPLPVAVAGSNLPPNEKPALPVTRAQETGFDRAAVQAPATPQPRATTTLAGFDTATAQSHTPGANGVRTGAFGQASAGDPQAIRAGATSVSRTGFDAAPAGAKPPAPDQTVRKTTFDEPKPVSAPAKTETPAPPAVRPVEILDKPKPSYTAEARQRKIEGTVLLDVVFTSTGEVRVLRVVRGLGYGLDENAIEAARHIRFHPATQAGSPVDQRVTLHVVFEMTG